MKYLQGPQPARLHYQSCPPFSSALFSSDGDSENKLECQSHLGRCVFSRRGFLCEGSFEVLSVSGVKGQSEMRAAIDGRNERVRRLVIYVWNFFLFVRDVRFIEKLIYVKKI